MSVNIYFLPLRQEEYPKGEGVDKEEGAVSGFNPPPPRYALVPLSQGDSWLQQANAITHFLPLRQAGEEDR